MGDEDDEGITIWYGNEKEIFNCKDANNVIKVRNQLGLDHEPACVFANNTSKRVEFGKLKDGHHYKIAESKKIPNRAIHAQNAVILSEAVYEEDPLDFLNKTSRNHSVKTIYGITKYSNQKMMVAEGEVEKEGVLYVVYRGSKSNDDFMTDIDIKQMAKVKMQGLFHAGFEERSRILSTEYILDCAQRIGCETIVICGHSLGGAVSSIAALDLMRVGREGIKIYNITFPFFGIEDVRKMCKEDKFAKNILHYVDYKDIVPGLLSLGHTITILGKQSIKFAGKSLSK